MKRFAALLLVLLSFAVSACSNLTQEEMAQLTFIAEEALVEVADDPADQAADQDRELFQAAPAGQSGSQEQPPLQSEGQTRRSVAAAVSAKIPVASPQGADASVWQARALVDALNLDPTDHSQCFRVLGRSFFNRCDQSVDAQTCQGQSCQTYRVPAGADLTIPHDYDSLTPSFLVAPQAAEQQQQASVTPTKSAPVKAKPQTSQPQTSQPQTSQPQTSQPKIAKAAPPAATAQPVQAAKPEAKAAPPEAKIPAGVPQSIQPEPAGSDIASTEFFGGFPLSL